MEKPDPAHSGAIPMPQRILLAVGSLGPIGHLPASGTACVLIVGIPLFWAFSRVPGPIQWLGLIVFAIFSVWIHQAGDRILGVKDARCLVWDELAGFFLAVVAFPFSWRLALAAFCIERALDIAKVPPARQIENRWPGGWGVVCDDLVAGVYTRLILMLVFAIAPEWLA